MANASSTWFEVTTLGLKKLPLVFQVKSARHGSVTHVDVMIKPGQQLFPRHIEARIADLKMGKGSVDSQAKRKLNRGPGTLYATYSFDVTDAEAKSLSFEFWIFAESNGTPMPSADIYWFRLNKLPVGK